MTEIAEKIKEKVTDTWEFEITEKQHHETLKKRTNWSAPRVDGIKNVWWKKLTGTWTALMRSMSNEGTLCSSKTRLNTRRHRQECPIPG